MSRDGVCWLVLQAGMFNTEMQPLDVFRLIALKPTTAEFVDKRAVFQLPLEGGNLLMCPPKERFGLGYVKGQARTFAAMFLVWALHSMSLNLDTIWPTLRQSLQVLTVRLHLRTSPESMLLTSMSALGLLSLHVQCADGSGWHWPARMYIPLIV